MVSNNEKSGSNECQGRVIIFSGPSGVGKTTVLKQIFAVCKRPLLESVSATTRPKRQGETEGTSYHYLTDAQFQKHHDAGDFLEAVEVFGRGHWYGTLKSTVQEGLDQGKWVILEIDVEGAQKVLVHYPEAITIFVHPPLAGKRNRIRRGTSATAGSGIERAGRVFQL